MKKLLVLIQNRKKLVTYLNCGPQNSIMCRSGTLSSGPRSTDDRSHF